MNIEPLASDPLPTPTNVQPGPAKAAVFALRYESGQLLWHPDDATGETSQMHRPGKGGGMRDHVLNEQDELEKIPQSLRDRLGKHACKLTDSVGPKS